MFSMAEKKQISEEVERVLLSFNHPEMPKEMPVFQLHVKGKEDWSYADIEPNWKFKDKSPGINLWNEEARGILDNKDKEQERSVSCADKVLKEEKGIIWKIEDGIVFVKLKEGIIIGFPKILFEGKNFVSAGNSIIYQIKVKEGIYRYQDFLLDKEKTEKPC